MDCEKGEANKEKRKPFLQKLANTDVSGEERALTGDVVMRRQLFGSGSIQARQWP